MPISNHNPMYMTPVEIATEIENHRNQIEASATRMFDLAQTLRERMRRPGTSDEARNVYVTCSNVWMRFAGMVRQGSQRTRQADRLLRMLREEEVEIPDQPSRPTPVDTHAQTVPTPSPFEDLITVYGEELVRDADGQQ